MTLATLTERLSDEQRYIRRIQRLQRSLDNLSERQVRAALALLAQARGDLLVELARTGASGWTSFHHTALLTAIEQASAEYGRDLAALLRQSMETAFTQGAQDGAQLAALLPGSINLSPLGIARGPLDVAIGLTADLVQRVSNDFRIKASREVALAVAGGQTSQQAMGKIADLLKAQPSRQSPGLGSVAAQAERIVRTELLTAYNVAARAREEQTAEAVPEIRKWWNAADDSRTRPDHRAADARYRPGGTAGPIAVSADFSVGGEAAKGPHDPRLSAKQRVNCRCITTLWHPEWGQ